MLPSYVCQPWNRKKRCHEEEIFVPNVSSSDCSDFSHTLLLELISTLSQKYPGMVFQDDHIRRHGVSS